MQSKLALLGCEQVFGEVPALVASLLGIRVNSSQVYRICRAASEALDEQVLDSASPKLEQQLAREQQPVYGMVDGSMLLRDAGWKETKVGRVFTAPPLANPLGEPLKWQMGASE